MAAAAAAVVVVMLAATPIADAISNTGPPAQAARSFHRCATFRDRKSPYGGANEDEYGVYILQGRVICQTAIRVQTAVFAGKGKALEGQYSAYSFYKGWYCDGQMGGYSCQNAEEHPGKRFAVLACSAPAIRCPVWDSHLGT
jgi:hypothetical protein